MSGSIGLRMIRRFRNCGVITEKCHSRNCPLTKSRILPHPNRNSTLLTWFMPLSGRMSLDHRRVLTLHFLEDMSVEEVAEVLATNTGTVKSRLHYAKAAMRRWMEEREHE